MTSVACPFRGLSLSNFQHNPQTPEFPSIFSVFFSIYSAASLTLYKFTFMHAHEFFCFFICFYFISFVYYIENKQNKNVCFFFLFFSRVQPFPAHFTLFIIVFSFSCLLMLLLFYFNFFSFLFFLPFIH